MSCLRRIGRNNALLHVCLALFVGLLAAIPSAAALEANPELAGFDREVEAAREALHVPGVAIGLLRNGQTLLAKGYGVRETGKPGGVDADTLFATGSMTKSFTTAVLAIQVDEGKLDWDVPVRQYLPWFRLYDPVATELATARDMAAHRTGMPSHNFIRRSTYLDRAELIRRFRYLPTTTSFREKFQYNNIMYVAAGYLAGEVAGSTWEDLVRERIFVPLGMTRSNTSALELARAPNHAMPHVVEDGKPAVVGFYDFQRFGVGPNGAVNSTVADILKYLRMYLEAGKSTDGRQIVSAEQVRELLTPVTVSGRIKSYALGWEQTWHHGERILFHGGAIDGFVSHMMLLPDRDSAIVVLSNAGTGLPKFIALRLADRLLGMSGEDYGTALAKLAASSQGEKSLPSAANAAVAPVRRLVPRRYVGTWFNDAYGDIRIEAKGRGLAARFDAIELILDQEGVDIFKVEGREGQVRFVGKTGAAPDEMHMPLERSAPDIVFVRKQEE